MRKVLGTTLILVVLIVFVVSCSDFGLSRFDHDNLELVGIGMAGIIFANQAIGMYAAEPDLVNDMITLNEGEFVTEATFSNFDFEKAFNRIGAENWDDDWDDFYDFNVVIQRGSYKEDSRTDTMTIDITFKVTGGDFPGTYHVVGSISETKQTLKVNGRNVDLTGFSN